MNEQCTNLTSCQHLHEYQAMPARRLQKTRTKSMTEGFLDVQVGEHHQLLPPTKTNEALDYRPSARVPLTQS